jgi:hypothetical protein
MLMLWVSSTCGKDFGLLPQNYLLVLEILSVTLFKFARKNVLNLKNNMDVLRLFLELAH